MVEGAVTFDTVGFEILGDEVVRGVEIAKRVDIADGVDIDAEVDNMATVNHETCARTGAQVPRESLLQDMARPPQALASDASRFWPRRSLLTAGSRGDTESASERTVGRMNGSRLVAIGAVAT